MTNNLFDKELSRKGIVHFWDLPNNYLILEENFRNRMNNYLLRKYKTIVKCSEVTGISKSMLGKILRKEYDKIKINFLIKIYNQIEYFSLEEIENNILWIGHKNSYGISNPKLPFNFNSRIAVRFVASIANDGYISDNLYYSNINKKLRDSVRKDTIFVFGGSENGVKEWIKNDDEYLSFPSVMRDVLIKITKFKGVKSEIDPSIPLFVFNNKELMLGWVEQTIADEGHVRFFANKYRRSITWRRSIDATEELSGFEFNKKEISIRKLSLEVQKIISNKHSRFIDGEKIILDKLGITFRTYNLGIYLTKNGRIKTRWEIQVTKRKNLLKLREMITIPDPNKENKFTEMMKGFVRYKEPLRVKTMIKKICNDKKYITSFDLKRDMNYKTINTAIKWLNFYEKNGLIKKDGYTKVFKLPVRKYLLQNG